MIKLFADTFYFLALLNKHDGGPRPGGRTLAAYPEKIVTTEWVLTELADGLASSRNRSIFPRIPARTAPG